MMINTDLDFFIKKHMGRWDHSYILFDKYLLRRLYQHVSRLFNPHNDLYNLIEYISRGLILNSSRIFIQISLSSSSHKISCNHIQYWCLSHVCNVQWN